MLTVRFLSDWKKRYKEGDVVELPEHRAYHLKDQGIIKVEQEYKQRSMRATIPTNPNYVTR